MKQVLEALLGVAFGLFAVFTGPAIGDWHARRILKGYQLAARFGRAIPAREQQEFEAETARRRILRFVRILGTAFVLLGVVAAVDAALRL